MDWLIFRMKIFLSCNPTLFKHFFVANFIEYAITYS